MKLTAIDLFCGCGGLSAGLREAGFRVKAAVEIDPLAASTYRKNHRSTKLIEADIRHVTGPALLQVAGLRPGELDLLAGCPPCQGFSRIRTKNARKAAFDDRNDLVYDFLRLTRSVRPKSVMLENVPALSTDRRFKRVVRELRALGYHIAFDVLDAAMFNVPQRRRRLIMIGIKQGPVALAEAAATQVTVRQAFSSLDGIRRSDPLHKRRMRHSPRIVELISHIPKDGGSRSALPVDLALACHMSTNGFNDVYGRMRWNEVSPTITGGCFNPSKGRYLHPDLNRAISLREAALLQGFPVTYFFPAEASIESVALMIGNALPPPFIAAHAGEIRKVLYDIKSPRDRKPSTRQSNAAASRSGAR